MKSDAFAQQIWYAGLGALSRAESEDVQWLEALIAEGKAYEAVRVDELKGKLTDFEEQTVSRTKRKFDDIEKRFETKVSQSLARVGLISQSELETLRERLNQLEQQINDLKD